MQQVGFQGSPRKRGKMRQAPRGTQQRQKDAAAGVKSQIKRCKPAPMEDEEDDDSTPAPLRAMLERQNTLRDMLAQDPNAGPTPMLAEGEDKCDEESLGDAPIAFHRRKSVEEMQLLSMLNTSGLLDELEDDDSEQSCDFDDIGQQPVQRRRTSVKSNNPAIMILRAMEKRKNTSVSNISDNLGNASVNFLQAVDGTLENLHASTVTSMRLDGETATEEKKEQEAVPEFSVDTSEDPAFEMEHPKPSRRRSSHRSRSGDVVKDVIRARIALQQARLKSKEESSLSEHTDQANGESPVAENQDPMTQSEHSDQPNDDLHEENKRTTTVEQNDTGDSSSRSSRSRSKGDSPEPETKNRSSSPPRRQRRRSSDQIQPLGKDGLAHSGTTGKYRPRSREERRLPDGCASPRKSRSRSSDSMLHPHEQSSSRRSSYQSSSRKYSDSMVQPHEQPPLKRPSRHSSTKNSEDRRSRSSDKMPPSERISSPRRRRSFDVGPSSERTSSPRRRSSKDNLSLERIPSPRRSKSCEINSSKERILPPRRSRSSDKTQSTERIPSQRRSSRRSSEVKQPSSSRSHRKSEFEHKRRSSSRPHSHTKEKSYGHRKRSKSQSRGDGRSNVFDPKPLFAPMVRRAKSLSDVFAFVGRSGEGPSAEQQDKPVEDTPEDNGEKKFQRLMVKFTSMRNLMSNDK